MGADKINGLPAGGVYDGVTNSTAVPLKIKCEANKTPRITFSATQFDNNDITLNNGDAKGVGFAVYHGDTNTKVDPQTGVSLEKIARVITNLISSLAMPVILMQQLNRVM